MVDDTSAAKIEVDVVLGASEIPRKKRTLRAAEMFKKNQTPWALFRCHVS